jgi:hypothetical protein
MKNEDERADNEGPLVLKKIQGNMAFTETLMLLSIALISLQMLACMCKFVAHPLNFSWIHCVGILQLYV